MPHGQSSHFDFYYAHRPVQIYLYMSSKFNLLLSVRHRVIERIGVLPAFDLNIHLAGEAFQLAGAGVGDDGDRQVGCSPIHEAGMEEDEGPGAAVQGAGDLFHGDVAGGARLGGAVGEHLPFAGGFEVAVKLLVEDHPADGGVGFVVRGLGQELDFEGAACVLGHGGRLWSWGRLWGL